MHLLLQQGLHLLRVGGGMDAGEYNLPLTQQGILPGLNLLDLGHQIGPAEDLLPGVRQFRPGVDVGLVGEACSSPRAPLHQALCPSPVRTAISVGVATVRYSPVLLSFNSPKIMASPPH